MAASDWDFCAWILQLATLRKETSHDGNVVFRGNHSCEVFARPAQLENEDAACFSKRLLAWKLTLPKGNTKVLAFAHEYLVTEEGHNNYSAALRLVEHYVPLVHKLSCDFFEQLRALGLQAHWWAANKPVVGGSLRGLRRGRRVAGYTQQARRAESLRVGLSRFKKQHPNFRDEYRMWYGAFRYEQKHPANALDQCPDGTAAPARGATYVSTARRFSREEFPTVPITLDPKKSQ